MIEILNSLYRVLLRLVSQGYGASMLDKCQGLRGSHVRLACSKLTFYEYLGEFWKRMG